MKIVFFLFGLILLIGVEIARVYFIMPFPGSQKQDVIELAYFLQNYILYFRIAGILLIAYPAWQLIRVSKPTVKWTVVSLLFFWLVVCYAFNFRFLADKMFYQPQKKVLVKVDKNKVDTKSLVLGVVIGDIAAAYPIEIIGYHHQVRDTVGSRAIMVTYCTVCRTGRVFSPFIDGVPDEFRLVGMDHFNAMFEDARTKSWWRQVNGEAIAGPMKGKMLEELPSEQMTLAAWLLRFPDSFILQPDSAFIEQYKGLEKYDEGKMEGKLEGKDSLSWKDKSWVVGVKSGTAARAYDWSELKLQRVINDIFDSQPILIVLENDTASFHAWSRVVGKDTLQFIFNSSVKSVLDTKTNSVWNWNGKCIEGPFQDSQLVPIQSYQEYWHSWRTFQPNTTRYSTSILNE